jgi:N-glycosylase/DNA lyase
MKKIVTNSEYFNVKDTLECGQVFRYTPYKKGYAVISCDKFAYCYNEGEIAVIECNACDEEYFYNYFDLGKDYSVIYKKALSFNVDVLTASANAGKGIRILNQNAEETIFSFIVSQNNNIPRIKGILQKLCVSLGEKKTFLDTEYYSFPTSKKLAEKPIEFFREIGLGYRAEYIKKFAEQLSNGLDVNSFHSLSTENLNKRLLEIHGIGPKVANCVTLFGYHRADSFPVDTWIEKVYREDFKGELKNRDKITEYFTSTFKENAGYFQQYLFYYERYNK